MRLLILGAGAVVAEYYATALQTLGWQNETVVVDPSPRALAAVRAVWPGADLRPIGFRDALADASIVDRVQAVVVALPNSLHEEAAALALERGLHVLCEKPLAPTRGAGQRLARAAEKADRVLTVGMVRRLLPSLWMLRQGMRQQLIGDLVSVDLEDGEQYAWLSESGAFFRRENGGVLADMGVHYLDFIEELAGELIPLRYCDDARGGVEANVEFVLETRSGAPVRLALSRTRNLRNTLVVRGERGELIAEKDVFDGCVWRSTCDGAETRLQPRTEWAPTLQACFARQLQDFKASIESNTPPAVSAERACSTIGLLDWAYSQRPDTSAARTNPTRPRLPDHASVCVTGATGFIGTHLVANLIEQSGAQVTAPVRSYRTCAEIGRFPVHMLSWNILDYESVRAAVSGARFVFHLAYGREGADAERITVDGTRNLVRAAIAAGCESIVVLSSVYVFGLPDAEVDESWPYQPVGGGYGTSKAKMERECLRIASSSLPTRVVVLNPSCVFGPRGRTYAEMPVLMTRGGGFALVEEGRGKANFTYIDNLVDAMLLAATSQAAHGERFIINDGTTTWREYLHQLLRDSAAALPSYTQRQLVDLQRARHRPSLVDLGRLIVADRHIRATARDTRVGELALTVADRLAPALRERLRRARAATAADSASAAKVPTSAPPVWLADVFGPAQTVFVAAKARRVLDWTPRVSLAAGMDATRSWVAEHSHA